MRVIAGELRGRPLLAPKGRRVRPTSDRVREAIFSALGEIGGARVADLFCGTGALGIEALSRGAGEATFVDRDLRAVRGNVEHLGLGGRSELVGSDVVAWLGSAERGAFELVFIDPPYRLADRIERELDSLVPAILAPGGRVIAESAARRPLRLASLTVLRERRYGSTQVGFLGREGP
ncbi:MAG: RsmD family RNA methyltransferase [Solirubrobacterales bacterium]